MLLLLQRSCCIFSGRNEVVWQLIPPSCSYGKLALMSKRVSIALISLAVVTLLAILLLQVPYISDRVQWRYEVWSAYFYSRINPLEELPTPKPVTPAFTASPSPTVVSSTPTFAATLTPTATIITLPQQVLLTSPAWEAQTMNNCGPATLTMDLRMFGWDIEQKDIDKVVKPEPRDRNVNPDELRDYVRNLGLMSSEFRVAGDITILKQLLAAGFPVMVEAATPLRPEDSIGPTDDLWSAHYLLVTGYDDAKQSVIVQDPLRGPDREFTYAQLMEDWKPFNYVYLLVYLTKDEDKIKNILGDDWDPDTNRQKALDISENDTTVNPNDAFGWFNLGSNLVYFERYAEAADAYDKAITIGLPQRMTRYQFGPFFAYFHADRIDYLLEITESTYKPINGWYAEEALLWHGYGLYRQGDYDGARSMWNKALEVHPGYYDAEVALNLLQ
jgi:hypothetical protein